MLSLQDIFKNLGRNREICVSASCISCDKIIVKLEESFTYKPLISVALMLDKPMAEQDDKIELLKRYYA